MVLQRDEETENIKCVPGFANARHSHLVEVRFGLDLPRRLVPLEVLCKIIRNCVLWAPLEQPLRLRKTEYKRTSCLLRQEFRHFRTYSGATSLWGMHIIEPKIALQPEYESCDLYPA